MKQSKAKKSANDLEDIIYNNYGSVKTYINKEIASKKEEE